jgi:hypothetical protein
VVLNFFLSVEEKTARHFSGEVTNWLGWVAAS